MRRLATVQRVSELTPIEGADRIEVASVLGWKVVVGKGDFSAGDLLVYIEIDSILPDREIFGDVKGKRIKTVRLRGQISQGICFPLDILADYLLCAEDRSADEDEDVTDLLGIIKWEPTMPACLSGDAKGTRPSFIPKTDETRIQVLQRVLSKYERHRFYVTEKLDGTSATFYMKDGVFGCCSRSMEWVESDKNTYWQVARSLNIEDKLRGTERNIAIQGEIIGGSIQGNKLGVKGYNFYVFNVFDIDKFEYFGYHDFRDAVMDLGLQTVPILNEIYFLPNSIDEVVKFATRRSVVNTHVWAEGIVLRPVYEALDFELSNILGNNGRVSFKVINPEFSLKYKE